MAQTFEFYDERAREAAAEADKAQLDNVRERALRSEKAWRSMADQALKTAKDREERAAVAAARRDENDAQQIRDAVEAEDTASDEHEIDETY
jgi:hypothetical protein